MWVNHKSDFEKSLGKHRSLEVQECYFLGLKEARGIAC